MREASAPATRAPPQLPDGLARDSGRLDVFGQNAIEQTLYALIFSRLSDQKASNKTIAFKGRYGQGKTTVLDALDLRLRDRWVGGHAIRLARFDVAAYRPETLAYDFDSVIAHWYTGRRWIIYSAVTVAALLGVEVLGGVAVGLGAPKLLNILTGTTVVGGVGAIAFMAGRIGAWARADRGIWKRPALRQALQLANIRRLWLGVMENLGGLPDILLVDNLDRAIVEQQKAFLLALRRHRDSLPAVVIVAFDETPLLLSDPSPETPRDILEKTFDTSLSLYPMTAKDAADIAIAIAAELLGMQDTDDAPNVCLFLRYIPVIGDLARILFLHQRHSFRSCKQFANEILATAHVLRINHPADFSALFRLQGLFVLLPWIRDDPVALADYLTNDDEHGLIAFSEAVGQRPVSETDRTRISWYLQATRHMQPYMAGWRHFTGRFGADAVRGVEHLRSTAGFWMPAAPDALLSMDGLSSRTDLARRWVEFDLVTAGESDADLRRSAYLRVLSEAANEPTHIETKFAWAYLVHRLWYADPGLPVTFGNLAERSHEPFLLYDEFLADSAAIPFDRLKRQRIAEAFVQLLPSTRASNLMTRGQAALFIAADVFAAGAPARDERILRGWLEECPLGPGVPLRTTFMGEPLTGRTRSNARILELSWPMQNLNMAKSDQLLQQLHADVSTLGALWYARAQVNFHPIIGETVALIGRRARQNGGLIRRAMEILVSPLPIYKDGGEGGWDLSPAAQIRDVLLRASEAMEDGGGWLDRLVWEAGPDAANLWRFLYLAILCGEAGAADGLAKRILAPLRFDLGYLTGLVYEAESRALPGSGSGSPPNQLVRKATRTDAVMELLKLGAGQLKSSSLAIHQALSAQLDELTL